MERASIPVEIASVAKALLALLGVVLGAPVPVWVVGVDVELGLDDSGAS